jgi:hypothetical protein
VLVQNGQDTAGIETKFLEEIYTTNCDWVRILSSNRRTRPGKQHVQLFQDTSDTVAYWGMQQVVEFGHQFAFAEENRFVTIRFGLNRWLDREARIIVANSR